MRVQTLRTLAVACVLAIGFSVALPLHATLIIEADVDQLVEWSDAVVYGTVEETFVEWNETGTKIYTHAFIRVEDSLSGILKREHMVHVVQFGGELDGVMMRLPGQATFEKGKEVVVFIEERRSGWTNARIEDHYILSGMYQGKFDVVEIDGVKTAVRDWNAPGVALVKKDATKVDADETKAHRFEMSLDDLIKQVKGVSK